MAEADRLGWPLVVRKPPVQNTHRQRSRRRLLPAASIATEEEVAYLCIAPGSHGGLVVDRDASCGIRYRCKLWVSRGRPDGPAVPFPRHFTLSRSRKFVNDGRQVSFTVVLYKVQLIFGPQGDPESLGGSLVTMIDGDRPGKW